MDDPHLLGPDLAPTPFTADEIRTGCPDGHTLYVRTTPIASADRGARTTVHRYDNGDADGVTLSREVDGDVHSSRVTWRELQAHAAFPAALATRSEETLDTPLGLLDCLRCDLAGDPARTFWFALAHPGMPIRYTDGRTVTEVVRIALTG